MSDITIGDLENTIQCLINENVPGTQQEREIVWAYSHIKELEAELQALREAAQAAVNDNDG